MFVYKTRSTKTTEAQLKSLKINPHPPKKHRNVPWNHKKWLPYQIVGGKTVKNVHIEPQTTEIWPS